MSEFSLNYAWLFGARSWCGASGN